MKNSLRPEARTGMVKSLRSLAALHGVFFLAAGFYLLLFAKQMGFIPTEFMLIGFLSLGASLRLKSRPIQGVLLSLFATILYWIFSFAGGHPGGFIQGISVTVSLMGILAVSLLRKKAKLT